MKMYVANCTQQVQDFIYRLPEHPAPRMQRIPIGSQIRLSGDLSAADIDAVVAQHRRYGMVEVGEVDRTKPFIGVCYSVDRPVHTDKIRVALIHNLEVLEERGRDIRRESAVSVSNAMEDAAPNLQSLEMSIVEEDREGATATFAEGTRVTRRGADGTAPPRNEARAARRAARRAAG